MNIQRINSYDDPRFSQIVLNQHGGFLVDGEPYEVEIISRREAVIRGREAGIFPNIIEEFRFYAPHITCFFDDFHRLIQEFPPLTLLSVPLKSIQPSQFYVDEDKVEAIRSYIWAAKDVIIQVIRQGERFISLDGHTRLYYAAKMGWTDVQAVEETAGDYILGFVEEAIRRGINSPYDLQLVSHKEYDEKWNKFCDDFLHRRNNGSKGGGRTVHIQRFTTEQIDDVIRFEKDLRKEEDFWGWEIDDAYMQSIKQSFRNERFRDSVSMLAYVDGKVVGRIDSTLICSHFDGSTKAYLDWICVLKSYRHKGVAQALMAQLRKVLYAQYRVDTLIGLIAGNPEAQRFYRGLERAMIRDQGIWIELP